ncbi:hypothetical protein, partial [Gimesia maris]|uniref:hypothetical protein n=1 Tax=Gimesia maris TaxID=122 RepID=UPI0030DBB1DE
KRETTLSCEQHFFHYLNSQNIENETRKFCRVNLWMCERIARLITSGAAINFQLRLEIFEIEFRLRFVS